MVRYKIGGPKFGLILTGGVSTGFMVQNDVTLVGANETRNFGQTSQIRNFNMNAHFGIGIEAKLTPFMYLNIEPTFKYSFLNWSMDSQQALSLTPNSSFKTLQSTLKKSTAAR